jgi:hypothetical protein
MAASSIAMEPTCQYAPQRFFSILISRQAFAWPGIEIGGSMRG